MTSPDAAAPDAAAPDAAAERPPAADPADPARPVLPEQSREDTDAAWGEYTGRDDDRLYRDRPPHWRDF